MSLILEPIIIGEQYIIDLTNYHNNMYYDMKSLNLDGEILICDTDIINIKLLHIKNYSLHYYCKNVIIDKNNNCVNVFLMRVPPPLESKRIESEPYLNNKRVKFDFIKYNKIIIFNTEFFGYCTDIDESDNIKEKIKDDIKKKKDRIYEIWINKKKILQQQEIKKKNLLLLEKAKIYECIIPQNKNMNDTYFGIDDFSKQQNNI